MVAMRDAERFHETEDRDHFFSELGVVGKESVRGAEPAGSSV
jgi:hypothetical protein